MTELLNLNELRAYFFMPGYVVRAVDGLSFTVHEGEIIGIVGESGCGKSQTAMSIMGLLPAPGKIVEGEIHLKDTRLNSLKENEYQTIRGNRISMIFQEPMTSLNPIFTVGYQLRESLELHRNMNTEEADAEAARLLKNVGMSDPENRLKEYPFQLSGGLRQRVMIAMAMACHPDLLIADEPTTALDVTIQAQILRLMREVTIKNNMATLFITHDLAVIASFTSRVIVMYAGVAVEDAPVQEIFKKPMHPYTQGLLNSIPVLGEAQKDESGRRRKLQAISGNLPDPHTEIRGCKFASRCPKVMKKCLEAEPSLVETETGHKVRCFLYNDKIRENASILDINRLFEIGGKNWQKEYERINLREEYTSNKKNASVPKRSINIARVVQKLRTKE